ncbi:hypothetical protein EON80_06000 [bacterium]|nr:MAG: hypothetical protein EON80_06000 [bacterium]
MRRHQQPRHGPALGSFSCRPGRPDLHPLPDSSFGRVQRAPLRWRRQIPQTIQPHRRRIFGSFTHMIMKTIPFFLAITAFGASAAHAQPATVLNVRGDVQKPATWTLARLQKAAPVQTIKATLKGKSYTAKGVSLWALIEAAEPKQDGKVKHSEARFVVLARAKDGYTVSFALPELMPSTGARKAFVVWEANGKPLSGKEGPLRLVIPEDKKPMRWIYGVSAIEIYDGKRLMK